MRFAPLVLGLGPALWVAACGDGGEGPEPPLAITSRSPAPDAVQVETGATVAVVFNRAIDPATLTAETFKVRLGGVVDVPAALTYEAATRTARAAVALLPAMSYEVQVTTGVRTPAGSGLGAVAVWTFVTRAWQAATVDAAGTVGLYTSLAVDGSGRLHVSYYDGTNGDLKYATCAASCATATNWETETVDAGPGTGQYTSLAVDASGRVHVSYTSGPGPVLKFATCTQNCATLAGDWQSVTVDASGAVGTFSSLAVDRSGRLHISYSDGGNGDLKYATCAAGCTAPTSWQTATVDGAGSVGAYSSLAVDGTGRLHISYADVTNAALKYATCSASCATATNWQMATVDAAALAIYTSLAVDGSGRLHISYGEGTTGELRYATCDASCAMAINWRTVTVDAAGQVHLSFAVDLAVDGSERVHVGYYDETNADLKYATCGGSCATASNWQRATVDAAGDVGLHASLAVDGNGRLHLSYYNNASTGDLKYIE